MEDREVFIAAGLRTPLGSLGGTLASVTAPHLGATCIKGVLAQTGVDPEDLDEVIMGNVLSAGVGQNPARQAAIYAGIPSSVGATTVNKVCGSGLKAVMLAHQSIRLGDSNLVVAGGMESMTKAPYLLPKAREGYRMGHGRLVDSMIHDGLWDIYGDQHMGTFGDLCAKELGFTRAEQDDFAERSYNRARVAVKEGIFDDEIIPVTTMVRRKKVDVIEDEEPARFDANRLRELRPAFDRENGTITAGNASSINDGAAALVVVSDAKCASLRLRPIARIVGHATFSREPEWFTLAPVGAIQRLMDRLDWTVEGTDLFEINEAFAAVTMAAMKELGIPGEKVNIHGGAVALGHPIGCSGARILVTLLNALKRTGGRRGIASLCIGGGEAVAMAIEMTEN